MIESIKGTITGLTPTSVVIETSGGVGYRLEISLPVYSCLQGKSGIKLLVHEAIREDTWVLYGFLDERERTLFRALIGVSGVGANTARLILSSIAAPELEKVIATGDYSSLKAVKGIGVKTAQRIIVDLKGKIELTDDDGTTPELPVTDIKDNESFSEALAALTMLGFARQQSYKALRSLYSSNPRLSVEDAIKQALAHLH